MLYQITKRLSYLFSTSTPWLVIGTALGISIMANGLSEIISSWQDGTSINSAAWLTGIGLLIILLLLISTDWIAQLRNFIQSSWQQKLITPNFEGEVKARPGLVVLVSNRPNPPAKLAIEHHAWNMIPGKKPTLTHCWLLAGSGDGEHSSINNARHLEKFLHAREIFARIIVLDNPLDVKEAFQKTREALSEALSTKRLHPEEIIVDYTGGTKPMTVGMLLAAVEMGIHLQYMDIKQLTREGRAEKGAGAIARPVNLSFLSPAD